MANPQPPEQHEIIIPAPVENLARPGFLIIPVIAGVVYETAIARCTCGDRELYRCRRLAVEADPAAQPRNHFWTLCALHGWQDLGPATRQPQDRDNGRTERRRKSGATTARWYHERGL